MTASARLRRILHPTAVRSWLIAAFLCALVAAEMFAVVHPLDLAAHANGEPCKICVSAASLDHAVAADVPILVPAPAAVDVAPPIRVSLHSREPVRQNARGPPTLS